MYLAIAIIYVEYFIRSGEISTFSREVDDLDKDTIVDLLMQEGDVEKDFIDTILVLENGKDHPKVVKHWSGMNGDF